MLVRRIYSWSLLKSSLQSLRSKKIYHNENSFFLGILAVVFFNDNKRYEMINPGANTIRPATVRLVSRLLLPLTDSGLVTCSEFNTIISELKAVAKGKPQPMIESKYLNGKEVATMLAISFSEFRKLEKEGAFSFRRHTVGAKTVRYLNTEVISYMINNSDEAVPPPKSTNF